MAPFSKQLTQDAVAHACDSRPILIHWRKAMFMPSSNQDLSFNVAIPYDASHWQWFRPLQNALRAQGVGF